MAILVFSSLSSIFGVFLHFFDLIRYFSPMSFIVGLANIAVSLIPLILLILLIINRKKNIQTATSIILLILGILKTATVVLSMLNTPFLQMSGVDLFIALIGNCVALFTGLILIFAFSSIKQRKRNQLLPIFTALALFAGLIPTLAMAIVGQGSLISNVSPLLLVLALAFLPKTIYDYNHCVGINKTSIVAIVIVLVVLFVIALISGGIANSDSNSNDYPYGFDACYRCKGSGLINQGFVDLKTCPVCKGSGMLDSH